MVSFVTLCSLVAFLAAWLIRRYDKMHRITPGNEGSAVFDCLVISAGLMCCANFYRLIFLHGPIYNVGRFLVWLVLDHVYIFLAGCVYAMLVAPVVEHLYKNPVKKVSYWLLCAGLCFVCIVVVCLCGMYLSAH